MTTEVFVNLGIQTKDIAVFVLQDGSLPVVNNVSLDSSFFLTAAFTATTSVSN